jgi:hypothetical protein
MKGMHGLFESGRFVDEHEKEGEKVFADERRDGVEDSR